jgi:GlpG protein
MVVSSNGLKSNQPRPLPRLMGRLLTTFNNPRMAQALVDYLTLGSIKVELKVIASQQVELWVEEVDFESATRELKAFVENPNDKKYLDASWQRNEANSGFNYQPSEHSLVKSWFAKGGWVTHSVVTLCLLVFASFNLGYAEPVYYFLQFPDSLSVSSAEVWRWFTPALMHFSLMHIAFNVLWWWMLGGLLERHFGRLFLLAFMLLTGVVSNYAQFVVSGSNQFGGLSGVVYALIGFCWVQGKLRPAGGIGLNDRLFGFAVIWLILGYTDILWMNIANTAHLSGLLAGLGFGFVSAKVQKG